MAMRCQYKDFDKYTNIHQDFNSDKVHVWGYRGDQKVYDTFLNKTKIYVEDPDGEYQDIYGNKYVQKLAPTKADILLWEQERRKFCERDIEARTKFLHDYYFPGIKKIEKNLKHVKIGVVDIEIESDGKSHDVQQMTMGAWFPINAITIKATNSDKIMTFCTRPYNGKNEHEINYKDADKKVVNATIKSYGWEELIYDDEVQIFNYFTDQEIDLFFQDQLVKEIDPEWVKILKLRGEEFVKEVRSMTEEEILEYNRDSTEMNLPKERALLEDFLNWWYSEEFDVFTGHNGINFDLHYIMTRCKKIGVDIGRLSPLGTADFYYRQVMEKNKYTKREEMVTKFYPKVPGLTLIDYLTMYRNQTLDPKDSYALQFLGMDEIGEGKIDLEGQVLTIFRYQWDKFIDYNIQDVVLLDKIEQKRKLFTALYLNAYDSQIPVDRAISSMGVIEGEMIKELHSTKMCVSEKQEVRDEYIEGGYHIKPDGSMVNLKEGLEQVDPGYIKGGYVMAIPGFYNKSVSFDFASFYPTSEREMNVSPETKVFDKSRQLIVNNEYLKQDLIKSPLPHIYYRKDKKGLLSIILEKIYATRQKYKKMSHNYFNQANEFKEKGDMARYQELMELAEYYDVLQANEKVKLNSFYGCIANKHFRYFDYENARVTTRICRTTIRFVESSINSYLRGKGFERDWKKIFPDAKKFIPITKDGVVLVDTDSCYVWCEEIINNYLPDMELTDAVAYLEEHLFDPFFDRVFNHYAKQHNCENLQVFKREKIATQMYVQGKKKYAVRILKDEDKVFKVPKIKYTGLELKKKETPIWCRQNLDEMVAMIFETQDFEQVSEYIRETYKEFKKQPIPMIASNKAINTYDNYAPSKEDLLSKGIHQGKGSPMPVRGSVNSNYLIWKLNAPLVELGRGDKVRYIYVKKNNALNEHVVSFKGEYPNVLRKYFTIDYDQQFLKTFVGNAQRFFDILGWGQVKLHKTTSMKDRMAKRRAKRERSL